MSIIVPQISYNEFRRIACSINNFASNIRKQLITGIGSLPEIKLDDAYKTSGFLFIVNDNTLPNSFDGTTINDINLIYNIGFHFEGPIPASFTNPHLIINFPTNWNLAESDVSNLAVSINEKSGGSSLVSNSLPGTKTIIGNRIDFKLTAASYALPSDFVYLTVNIQHIPFPLASGLTKSIEFMFMNEDYTNLFLTTSNINNLRTSPLATPLDGFLTHNKGYQMIVVLNSFGPVLDTGFFTDLTGLKIDCKGKAIQDIKFTSSSSQLSATWSCSTIATSISTNTLKSKVINSASTVTTLDALKSLTNTLQCPSNSVATKLQITNSSGDSTVELTCDDFNTCGCDPQQTSNDVLNTNNSNDECLQTFFTNTGKTNWGINGFNFISDPSNTKLTTSYCVFDNVDGTSSTCDSSCNTCDVCNSDSDCLTCNGTDLLLSDGTEKGKCKPYNKSTSTIYAGYYPDDEDNPTKYLKCDSSCQTCTKAASNTNCKTCNTGYYLTVSGSTPNKCISNTATTPDGYYKDTSQYTGCHTSCKSCSDNTAAVNKCVTCYSGFYLHFGGLQDGKCLSIVFSGYGYDSSNNRYGVCHSNCGSCSIVASGGKTNCASCKTNLTYHRIDDPLSGPFDCHPDTDSITGYFFSIDKFDKCATGCETCSDIESITTMNCLGCTTDYYSKVDDSNETECYKQSNNPNGYYFNIMTSKFDKCNDRCSTCKKLGVNTDSKCLTCATNHYPLTTETIDLHCYQLNEEISGYGFNSAISKFNPCYASCKTCSILGNKNAHQCTDCKVNFGYYPNPDIKGNCNLYNSPPDNYYFDQLTSTFKLCHTGCKTCPGPGIDIAMNCDSCAVGYGTTDIKHQCYPIDLKLKGYVYSSSQKKFIACHKNCFDCNQIGTESDTKCLTCNVGFTPILDDKSQCRNKTSILPGITYVNYYKSFVSCYSSCETCSSPGTTLQMNCLSCKNGYNFFNSTSTNCIPMNSDGIGTIIKDDGSRDTCYKTCKSCDIIGNETQHLCNNCIDNYAFADVNSTNCVPINTYSGGVYNKETQRFETCYKSCGSCVAIGNDNDHKCSSCKTDYYPLADNLSMCYIKNLTLPNYYLSVANNDSLTNFKLCYASCYTCASSGSDSINNCLTCKTGYFAYSTVPTTCIKGSSLSLGFYINNSTGFAESCYPTCKGCNTSGNSENNGCTSCASG